MSDNLQTYPDYKDSGIDWLGDVPLHWEVDRIKHFVNEINERSKNGDEELLSVSQYTGVTPRKSRVKDGKQLTNAESLKEYKIVLTGDLVINIMLAWNGSLGRSEYDGIVSPSYAVFRFLDAYNSRFYHYLFRTPLFKGIFKTVSTGVVESRLRLYPDVFGRLPSVVPPPDEQDAIVQFLDVAEAHIKRYIRAKQKLIKLLTEQKQAIIQQAVTRGLNPDVPMKDSGVEWLGEIPEHWELWKIGHFSRLGNGSTPSRGSQAYWLNGTYPWLNSSSVNQEFITNANQFVTEIALKECHLPIVPAGSLLVAITGQGKTRGTAALLMFEATINQHMAYITPNLNRISGEFLQLFLKGMYSVLRFISESSGSTRAALTVQDLKDFKVLIPPLDEQERIVHGVKQRTTNLDEAAKHAFHEIDLIQEYRTRLIADVVTGKVDVRGMVFEMPEEFAENDLLEVDEDELFDDDLEIEVDE